MVVLLRSICFSLAFLREHRRQMRRQSAVEPVIGHIKSEQSMGRNYLAGQQGDAIPAAAGYNFSLLLRWLKDFLSLLIALLQLRPKSVAA